MRILHVAESFESGVFKIVQALAAGLVADGHTVAIAHGVKPATPSSLEDLIPSEVERFELPWSHRTPKENVAAAVELRRLAKRWNPDLVHLHSSFAGAVGSLAIGSSVPTVYTPQAYAGTMHGGNPLAARFYRWIERRVSRRVTMVGASSQEEAAIARAYGATRVEVINNGVPELEADRVIERDLPAEPRVIAMGRTVPQRQPEACARILGAVQDVAEVAWIGGTDGDRGEGGFQALAAAGITPSGWRGQDGVLEELDRATAYLHWTAWDGLPLSVLEAIGRDVVVVASDIAPNREILGEAGVRSTEREAIALLRDIVSDPAVGRSLLESQRSRRARFSASRMVEGWERVYEELTPGT